MKDERKHIETFKDIVDQCGMMPNGKMPKFAVTNPLEMHFIELADKHGVVDEMSNPDFEWDQEP